MTSFNGWCDHFNFSSYAVIANPNTPSFQTANAMLKKNTEAKKVYTDLEKAYMINEGIELEKPDVPMHLTILGQQNQSDTVSMGGETFATKETYSIDRHYSCCCPSFGDY